jgi:DNA-directed RNA polymerase subunit M/transcription elongation factor TFIIS
MQRTRRQSRLSRERIDFIARDAKHAKILFLRNIFSGISFSPMESLDQQLQRLKENYTRMTEDELCAVAKNAYDLTDIAREALQAVITERGFTVRLKLEPSAPLPGEPPEDDEGLINFQWPDNADHAWRWMKCLTAAGIPSFLGPDNVMHLEEFQGKFDGPVSLKIRGVDRERAYDAVARARARARADDDNEKKDPEDNKDYAILCPNCHSMEVVLEGRDSKLAEPPPTANFFWHCDACGHRWSDEGIEQEVPPGKEQEGSAEEHR